MKKFSLAASFLLALIGSPYAQEAVYKYSAAELFPEVTPIQLRAMQTRKFKKSYAEVLAAIKTSCADANGEI